MQPEDFTRYKQNDRFYGGSERKIGITVNEIDYILKYQKHTAFGRRDNHLSEFLGSHIFELCGFNVQETLLGYRGEEQVVACRDFNSAEKEFVPFNDVGESTLDHDKESYLYEYENIMQMLHDNSKLTNVADTIDAFWDLYIMDAFLGNFDRHGGNWGFMKSNNRYSMAPIFDNGSCLFPNLTDDREMERILSSREEMVNRVYKFPTSQIRLNGRKSSYYDVIHSLQFEECNAALKRIVPRIDLAQINAFIDEMPLATEAHKKFYREMLATRYKGILQDSYTLLKEGN